MGYTIAIAGKGGTGKTTISSLLIQWLRENKKGSILAVDADPNANLASALGVKPQENIGSIIDSIAKNPSLVPAGMSKDQYINYQINTALAESNGFDLLVMGRPEGPGCYCYVNNVLRQNIQRLISNYDYIVIDNEAGMEHFSRRTTRVADCLILISDYNVTGLRTVKNISNLICELDIVIKKKLLVVNRVRQKDNSLEDIIKDMAIEFASGIPEDSELAQLGIKGGASATLKKDSLVWEHIRKIGEKIWQ